MAQKFIKKNLVNKVGEQQNIEQDMCCSIFIPKIIQTTPKTFLTIKAWAQKTYMMEETMENRMVLVLHLKELWNPFKYLHLFDIWIFDHYKILALKYSVVREYFPKL